MKRIVMFSGGIASWATAKRVAERYGTDDLILLFYDTLMEDEDLYRFINEAATNVGGTFVRLCEGRTPWQVFTDERFLGNHLMDPCSKILKRQMGDRWLVANCTKTDTTVYLGFDWTEMHRVTRAKKVWDSKGWRMEAPMAEPPMMDREQMREWLEREGIQLPRLYKLGAPHNNCGGFCIKAGQAQFRWLLETFPDRYAWHEQKEQEIRALLNKDVSILRDRRGGQSKPLTMQTFRLRIEADAKNADTDEWGGCGCMEEAA